MDLKKKKRTKSAKQIITLFFLALYELTFY